MTTLFSAKKSITLVMQCEKFFTYFKLAIISSLFIRISNEFSTNHILLVQRIWVVFILCEFSLHQNSVVLNLFIFSVD